MLLPVVADHFPTSLANFRLCLMSSRVSWHWAVFPPSPHLQRPLAAQEESLPHLGSLLLFLSSSPSQDRSSATKGSCSGIGPTGMA